MEIDCNKLRNNIAIIVIIETPNPVPTLFAV